MNTLDVAVIWLNLILAATSALAAGWAATTDDPRRRPLWGAAAAIAVAYTGGYTWIITGGDVTTWSRVFRGVSIVTWPVVWIIPPIRSAHTHRRDIHRLHATRRKVAR